MKDQLQKSLKAVIEQGDAIEKKVNDENRVPTAEETKTLADLASKATDLTKQIGNVQSLEAAKKFGEQSNGTVAGAVFSGDTFAGHEEAPGDLSDVSSSPEGELYSLKGIGSKKLELLKSGAYKDAFNDKMRADASMGRRSMKAESMKVLADVGFGSGEAWLPPDYRSELIKKIATITSVRRNASAYTTGTDIVTFPAVNYYNNDQYTSGVRFSWRGSSVQTSAITEATNPVAGQVKIPVNLATASIILQREMFEDAAFDILGYVTQLGGEAFGLGEEDAFTTGDGNGSPQGFTYHPAAHIAVGTNTKVAGLTYAGRGICGASTSAAIAWIGTDANLGIISVEKFLAPQYEAKAKWFANKATYSYIRGINAGSATLPQWSLGDSWPNYANGMNPSLLGYSVEKNQFMADIAVLNVIPLVLGDMSGYYIMDRVGLTVEVNPWVYQLQDQVVVYMRKRTGGQLVHYWKMIFCQSSPTIA